MHAVTHINQVINEVNHFIWQNDLELAVNYWNNWVGNN